MESSKTKAAKVFGIVLFVSSIVAYCVFKLLTIVIAFKAFSALFALATLIPVLGDLLYSGACIAAGNWNPALIFTVIGVAFIAGEALAVTSKK